MTRRLRLTLQFLESRDAPSGIGEPVAPLGDVLPIFRQRHEVIVNAAPVITHFRAIVGAHGHVTFKGTVRDDQAVAGLVVHITGNGVNVFATVQRNGTFTVTTTVKGLANVTVKAQTTDALGATSDPVQTTFMPSN